MEEKLERTVLTGERYRDLLLSGAHALQMRRADIDRLNVYPVPDGDTGSNMSMTVAPMDALTGLTGSLETVSSRIASQFLRSARGNSGVILSLFFRGVSRGFRGMETAGADAVRAAFLSGVEEAYKAVQDPKEGTILTVMRVSAGIPFEGDSLTDLFRDMLRIAEITLEKTPDLLPVLKQAGVVDSGGTGFTEILRGMLSCLEGRPVKAPATASGPKEETPDASAGADFASFETGDIENPYCTECILTKRERLSGREVDSLRRFVLSAGDSAVFADDVDIIKIHVHTKDPGRVLSEALKYGSLYTVKVENMRNQHTRLLNRDENGPSENADPEEEKTLPAVPPEKPYGFVAVTMGEGIESAFRDFGVDQFVFGGQTMNPSTSQLADAVLQTPAETVFILPNNGNVCLVAEQAARMIEDRKAVVIPSLSVPMGLSAVMAFDPDSSPEENEAAMKDAMSRVRTVEVTFAAHDAKVNGTEVKEGQILGLVDRQVVETADDRMDCLRSLLSSLGPLSFLTVFTGTDVGEAEKAEAERLIRDIYPRTDAVVLDGGQPLYAYVISAES